MGGGMMGGSGSSSSASGPVDLLTVSVAAADQAGSVSPPNRLRTLPEASASSVSNRRTVALGQMSMGNSEFVIDGRSFAPGRIDESVVLGTTEEWTLRNDSMMDHPFHLHVWPFVVVDRSDGHATDPGWRDTVNVPAGQSVTIRVPFKNFGGTTVYHCHILDHEDLGMMGTIQVA